MAYTLTPKLTAAFRARYTVDPETGCWDWTGTLKRGQSLLYDGPGARMELSARRYSWALAHPDEPEPGPFLRHDCGNTKCVNPEHLRDPATTCVNGHALTPENSNRNGRFTQCRTCAKDRSAARRAAAK